MEQSMPGASSKLSTAWYVALAIVCCLILAYGFFYSKNTTDDVDHLVGYNLPLALVLWGVFHMMFGRKKGGAAAGVAFGFIFACLMMKSFIGYERNIRAMNEVMSSIPRDIAEFMDGAVDAQGVPKRIEKPIDTTPTVTGEMGEVQR